jgi:hypothetical protein
MGLHSEKAVVRVVRKSTTLTCPHSISLDQLKSPIGIVEYHECTFDSLRESTVECPWVNLHSDRQMPAGEGASLNSINFSDVPISPIS